MVELEIGNEREAEKLLKDVVLSGTDHLQAAFQLAVVQQSLGRAESTLQKTVSYTHLTLPTSDLV